jgi:acetoacetyl-[acyl-carrier protein] synthase
MAKALAAARAIVGERALRNGGLVQAHGTGTPQNRTTESMILSRAAQAFGIDNWPVAAVKCYLGHSLGAAAGDQVTATLGIWARGLLPGIATIDEVAEDVSRDNLSFSSKHREIDPAGSYYAIVNSKGFGGNNASATLLSPASTCKMLQARYGAREWRAWQAANEAVRESQLAYDEAMVAGQRNPVYRFDHGVLHDDDVCLADGKLRVGDHAVSLDLPSPFEDMRFD